MTPSRWLTGDSNTPRLSTAQSTPPPRSSHDHYTQQCYGGTITGETNTRAVTFTSPRDNGEASKTEWVSQFVQQFTAHGIDTEAQVLRKLVRGRPLSWRNHAAVARRAGLRRLRVTDPVSQFEGSLFGVLFTQLSQMSTVWQWGKYL